MGRSVQKLWSKVQNLRDNWPLTLRMTAGSGLDDNLSLQDIICITGCTEVIPLGFDVTPTVSLTLGAHAQRGLL